MLLYLASLPAQAPIPVQRTGSTFVLDGQISPGEWDHINPLDVVMQVPDFGNVPTEKTEIRLAYDDNYIYLSGQLLDSAADKIMYNSKKRDALTGSTDWFGLVIDSYNDKENALAFFTTPTGLRLDASVINDATGREPVNISWNNFWTSKVSRDSLGWYVEIQIPFTSLQYQPIDGNVVMGITTWRYIARKAEVAMFPPIRPEFGDWSAWKPSFAREFSFEGVGVKKPFYIIPYALGGYGYSNELNDAETAYEEDKGHVAELGLDVKYGISNNWTLDLSYNTDFAQVEVDDQQVNLTRFSLFFPEKRLFFQERSGIFSFNLGFRDQLFYSRRIGIDEDGVPIPIYGGARLVGRTNDWDIGVINMTTEAFDTLNTENFTVLRTRRNVINDNSTVGFLVTNRTDFSGQYNTSYGLDATIRTFGDDFLSLRFAQTFDDEYDNDALSLDPTFYTISYVRRNEKGFSYGSRYARSGRTFDPEMGFLTRENFERLFLRFRYLWFPGEQSPVFRHGPRVSTSHFWSNESGLRESGNFEGAYEVGFKKGWGIRVEYQKRFERLTEEFDLSDDVIVPIGAYNFDVIDFRMNTPSTIPYVLFGSFSHGGFFDGKKTSVGLNPTLNISSSLEMGIDYQYDHITFDSRNDTYTSHITRIRALIMLSTKLSFSSFVQYSSSAKKFLGNFRLRYNPSEGNDFFIVLNSDRNFDLEREVPHVPETSLQSILLKYTYTFSL